MELSINQLYIDINKQLQKLADDKVAKSDKVFHKYDNYRSYGVRIPKLKSLIKSFKSHFQQLSLSNRFILVKQLYQSHYSENGRIGNYILELSLNQITPQHYHILDDLTQLFTNWDQTDDFSIHTMQPLIQRYESQTIELLSKWNSSTNMWQQRISLVTFTRKLGEAGKHTDIVIDFCNNLLTTNQDLIRKAIGWTLKDNMVGNKKKITDYIRIIRSKGVSSTIILYAIRNMPPHERKNVLAIKPDKTL